MQIVALGGIHLGDDNRDTGRYRRIAVVADRGYDLNRAVGLGADADAVLRNMNGVGAREPDVAIDAGALVEPAFTERGIYADQQGVGLAVGVDEIGEIDRKRRITAVVLLDDIAIEDDRRLAEDTVEFQSRALAIDGDIKDLAIPADAGFGKIAAERLEAVVGGRGPSHRASGWRISDRARTAVRPPVVRQVERAPRLIVEIRFGGGRRIRPLLGIGAQVGAETEILRHIVEVAEGEPPAVIEQDAARVGRCNRGVPVSTAERSWWPGPAWSGRRRRRWARRWRRCSVMVGFPATFIVI